jgi:hypothetical protein
MPKKHRLKNKKPPPTTAGAKLRRAIVVNYELTSSKNIITTNPLLIPFSYSIIKR